MATYVDSSMLEQQASTEEIHDMMLKKAHDLFALCDTENKGFITKRDMQRLQDELPLTPDQLEDVFDSLDDDGNGYLTREEFTDGFGGFVGVTPSMEKQHSVDSNGSTGPEHVYEEQGDDEEEHFQQLVSNTVLDDPEILTSMWSRLRSDNPELLPMYEMFISRVTSELKRKDQIQQSLETALKTKSTAHDEAVRKLSEEMEQQMKAEKERVMAELVFIFGLSDCSHGNTDGIFTVLGKERARERQLREEMESKIDEKDTQLNNLLSKHSEIKQKLDYINSQEYETKQENEKLLKERFDLEDMLNQSQRNLDDSRSYINELRAQYRKEKKERAMAAMQISEGIALERESLVKQLDLLRDMNKKLRDDQDEATLRRLFEISFLNGELRLGQDQTSPCSDPGVPGAADSQSSISRQESGKALSRSGSQLVKQGSIMSNYFSPEPLKDGSMGALDSDDDIECDDSVLLTNPSTPLYAAQNAQLYSTADQNESLNLPAQDDMEISTIDGSYPTRYNNNKYHDRYRHDDLNNSSDTATNDARNRGKKYVRSISGYAPPGDGDELDELDGRGQYSLSERANQNHNDISMGEGHTSDGRSRSRSPYSSKSGLSPRDRESRKKSFDEADQSQDNFDKFAESQRGSYISASPDTDQLSASQYADQLSVSSHANQFSASPHAHQFSASPHAHQFSASPHADQLSASSYADQLSASPHADQISASPHMDNRIIDGTRPKTNTNLSSHVVDQSSVDDNTEFDLQSPRGVPVGGYSHTVVTEYDHVSEKDLEAASPERLFKIVFVGDSGVGKSSFIHQFCNHKFKATFSATIGVDFQVKNMKVDGHIIALQLWDTAGQERFRSITKQYFRKADGVLVMYDVTSELSYKNIRNWMNSVQEGTNDNTVIAIAGNKLDLVESEDTRAITTKDGSKLADEYGALFYEVSAKSGHNVVETLQGMASLLREREDEEMEKALNLTANAEPKKKCCS